MQKKRDYSSERFQPKPRAFHLFIFRAGLLTYSRFGRLPVFYKTVAADHPKAFMELTAAGLSRIYTWFPFHRFPIYRKPTPGGNTKVKIFIRKGAGFTGISAITSIIFLSFWAMLVF